MPQSDIAIIGLSFKFPQDAREIDSFWDILHNGRNLRTDWPQGRLQLDSFFDPGPRQHNKLASGGSYFLKDDSAAFDAPFFSITAKEAAAMDPQQRRVLETSYHAFENAGIPLESLKGSTTAVYAAFMSDEYLRMYSMDPETIPPQGIMGTVPSILANRVSWYFDLLGPSVTIDTACSGSMVAVDLAIQSLRRGDSSMALVCAPNLMLGAEGTIFLSNLNFLSPDSTCHSFDHQANGYARGEGVAAIILKPVSDAIRDGDNIRAVIRESGSNQDGRTPTLTQPSIQSQEALIRHVYRKAGLDFTKTRYFEAHGTGTPIGDPIEMKAIGRVFKSSRSSQEPLYVGSVKSNIGHLEGCSGLAGIIKSVMVLEKGIIPPNALFEKMNPSIDSEFYHTTVPTRNVPWPCQGLRRVSVNSFGFGGTNSHIIMDDAYHYLEERQIMANHCTNPVPYCSNSCVNGVATVQETAKPICNGTALSSPSILLEESKLSPRLLAFSANDEKALARVADAYKEYFGNHCAANKEMIDRLAYTLSARRSKFRWRSFSVSEGGMDCGKKALSMSKAVRTPNEIGLAFVFTGQGAQYVDMGKQLLYYPVFENTIRRASEALQYLGCGWDIFDAFGDAKKLDQPEYSQPICTALQIALVELLKSFNVRPTAVVGHSSGEIAAAYTVGALSFDSAMRVAYFRGKLVSRLLEEDIPTGAMMSVNLARDEAVDYVKTRLPHVVENAHVACVNSPMNCTISGTENALDELKTHLDKDNIFAMKVKTGVAYHTSQMAAVASDYLRSMGDLQAGSASGFSSIPMVSSVTGKAILRSALTNAQYWVDNLVSPVQFSMALGTLIEEATRLKIGMKDISDILEVGPHQALKRPILQILEQHKSPKRVIRYQSLLNRTRPGLKATLETLGSLFCHGYPISLTAVNQQDSEKRRPLLPGNAPEYPFDHSRRYWIESRLSHDFRFRKKASGDMLGLPSYDWNPLEPRWRKFFSVGSMPWLGDHIVTGTIVLPGTALLVMAVEAVKQMCPPGRRISSFLIKEAQFLAPVLISGTFEEQTETMTHLRPIQMPYEKVPSLSDVRVFMYARGTWTECFRSRIISQYEESQDQLDSGKERRLFAERVDCDYREAAEECTTLVDSAKFYQSHRENGVHCGESFKTLEDIRWDGKDLAVATIRASNPRHQTNNLVHPAILDSVIQIAVVQNSKGAAEKAPTFIPHQMNDVWLSADGWQSPDTSSIRLVAEAHYAKGGRSGEAKIHGLADDGRPLISIKSLMLSRVSNNAAEQQDDKKLLYGLEWKPQLSQLDPVQLRQVCGLSPRAMDMAETEEYRLRMNIVLDRILRDTLNQMIERDLALVPDKLKKHLSWMQYYAKQTGIPQYSAAGDNMNFVLDELESSYPQWKLFPIIARNLRRILLGETDAEALVGNAALVETFYADVLGYCCDSSLHTFLDLLTHEKPSIRILEVGTGAGVVASYFLPVLRDLESRSGSLKFSEYHISGMTSEVFEATKSTFKTSADRVSLSPLDLKSDAGHQGQGEYDLVIAGNVFHTATNIASMLQRVHRALRPGGRLLLFEPTTPGLIMNFGFGVLPGWWVGEEKARQWSPILTANQWDSVLRQNGFSGNDLTTPGLEDDSFQPGSLIATTASTIKPLQNHVDSHGWIIVADTRSERQVALAEFIQECATCSVNVVRWDAFLDISTSIPETIICLVEIDKPLLATILETDFSRLKSLFTHCQDVLWVTSPNPDDDSYPYYDLAVGLLRTIRSEASEKHIVTLSVEQTEEDSVSQLAGHVVKVVQSSFDNKSDEVEYVVRDGMLTVGRMIEQATRDRTVRSLVTAQPVSEAWKPGPPLKLSLGTPGILDTLELIEDEMYSRPLGPNEIEIETKAWGINFRDIFVALGRLEGDTLGYDCSGVVSRMGSACKTDIRIGDRVCMISVGAMRTYARSPDATCIKMPDTLSFADAASLITPGMTAYHSLIEIARLRRGEKILIHSAAGSTGQMACWVAKMVGAEIFATVGFADKRQLLVEQFGIPEDHIFYSRNTTFADGVMRVTKGYGVDVILNSLSGDGLRASWDCIAAYGRFVEIGKSDIVSNASLPMGQFAKNVSFAAVDLFHMGTTNSELCGFILRKTMELIASGAIKVPAPLHIYPVSQVEAAFRHLQSGKSTGKIIISISDDDVVPKRLLKRSGMKLNPDASYLIAGGLGGLGRGIIRWMARKGARNLILPSRSGPKSQPALDVISELRGQGVTVMAPKCDVSSKEELASLLEDCSKTMPPIKGCINAAMHLQDTVFENMTHEQFATSIRSKVQTSWNLHALLGPSEPLDFFVLLSSLSGIYGNASQGNYAAGCTFQDALARHRASRGLRAASLDIGWMRNIGVIAENQALQQRFERGANTMGQIEDTELMAVLEIYCDNTAATMTTTTTGQADSSSHQCLIGVVTPADLLASGREPPASMRVPMFAGFAQARGAASPSSSSSAEAAARNSAGARFRAAGDAAARAEVVVRGLVAKLAKSLSVPADEVETGKPLSEYGVDSLMAVELRNWIRQDFAANVAVFDIMGGTPIASIGDLVVEKSEVGREKKEDKEGKGKGKEEKDGGEGVEDVMMME
ncbi:hypothetical protein F4778DRAFT_779319 [Xylariomycetidae sp. FL2044]|nr:hypothetical protein F4778DRAFT_779319 [Xylariomycetidae sp. FL2044]